MCTSNVYTYVYPDGHKEQTHQPALCSASRHGEPCPNNVIFKHPSQFVQYGDGGSGAGHFPPTPPSYTPRSNTPNYRSGDESDRSRRSSSSSRQHRSSGVYINGQKVIDLNRRDGSSSRRERIVLVDGPPTPRTPPQIFNFPHTAPSSPNANIPGPSPRESASSFIRRPVIVDDRPRVERPRIQIEVLDTSLSHHRRQSSASSHDSRARSGAEEDDISRRRREREERRVEKQRDEEEERQRRIRLRVAKANAEINKRPPVPVPPAPIRASSFSSTTATVGPAYDAEAELVDGVKHMSFEEERREEKARRLARKQEKQERQEREEEEEAQRQRLAERMMPRRRATVGPGSRRHRVVYDDGVYRWE